MPVSLTTLQIYDQYLTTYRDKDKHEKERYSTHDTSELESVYSNIQWLNRFAPVYLNDPSPKSIAYAVHLKESADNLRETINSLSESDNDIFSLKSAYSDNEALASVEYVPDRATIDTPIEFDLTVKEFATPQVNTGTYLKPDEPVKMKSDSYSFDLLTNKLHYEIQFNVNKDDTNLTLQSKIMRLINDSGIGVTASVNEYDGCTSLEITSNNIGKPYQGDYLFSIVDDNTSYTKGIVEYLGLDSSIKTATNAIYTINGEEKNAYANTFKVHGAYRITLHPESTENKSVHIGLSPDEESISNNISAFISEYNNFLTGIVGSEEDDTNTKLLSNDMKKFLEEHADSLSPYGITINNDSTLTYEKSAEITNADTIKAFGESLIKKLSSITIDPMEYVERTICSYPNPNTTYPNPYMTSIYSGMLFNAYT